MKELNTSNILEIMQEAREKLDRPSGPNYMLVSKEVPRIVKLIKYLNRKFAYLRDGGKTAREVLAYILKLDPKED